METMHCACAKPGCACPPPCTGGRHQWNAHRPKLKFRGKETIFDCCPACGVTVGECIANSEFAMRSGTRIFCRL